MVSKSFPAFVFAPVHPSKMPIGSSGALMDLWSTHRGSSFAPDFDQDFPFDDIPDDLMKSLTVVEVIEGGRNYRYLYWGQNNIDHKGYDMTGKFVTDSPRPESITTGFLHYGWVVEHQEPIAVKFDPRFLTGAYPSLVSFRFPFSSDRRTVNKILSYQPMEVAPEQWDKAFRSLRAGKWRIET